MDQDDFVRLAFIAFGLVILTFVILGFSRLIVPFHVAQTLAAPTGVIGFGLIVFLFLRATASVTGIAPIEEPREE